MKAGGAKVKPAPASRTNNILKRPSGTNPQTSKPTSQRERKPLVRGYSDVNKRQNK